MGALNILSDEAPLRGKTPFRSPELGGEPRALRALSQIIEGGLCHRCGSCVGICPTDTLATDSSGYPTVKNLSACTDCDLCVKVCPGDEFDFKALHQEKYGVGADLSFTHGHFLESFIGYSTDPYLRERSTSGGVVTAVLIHMLETKAIDGAVVITSDEKTLWKGKPIVAKTKEELLAATKSKYAISPTNEVFSEIKKLGGKYALVGLPCQIHGFIKASKLDPKLKEQVVLTIGLVCHAAVEHEAYDIIWDLLGDKAKDAMKFTSRIGKHPGAPHITMKDGSLYPVYYGDKKGYKPSSMEVINILYRLYSPKRCLTCFDAMSEFADITVGDPWMAPPDETVDFYKGWSFVLTRSEAGKKACKSLENSGGMIRKDVSRKTAIECNSLMANEKRWRAFRIIESQKRQGKPVPSYGAFGEEMPKQSGIQFFKTESNMLSHILCYLPRWREPFLRFMLTGGGYSLFYLNNLRRKFRFWRRDTWFMLRRNFSKDSSIL